MWIQYILREYSFAIYEFWLMILTKAFSTVFSFKLLLNWFCAALLGQIYFGCAIIRGVLYVSYTMTFKNFISIILWIWIFFKRLNYKLTSQLSKYLELPNHFTSESSSPTTFLSDPLSNISQTGNPSFTV